MKLLSGAASVSCGLVLFLLLLLLFGTTGAVAGGIEGDDGSCVIATPSGNVSVEWLQFYGNVSHWQFNHTPAVLTISLCKPVTTPCSPKPIYLQILPYDVGCSNADGFSDIATPLAFSDGTATLQFISATYLATLYIACRPGVEGLQPDATEESTIEGSNYNIFLVSETVCPGYNGHPSSGGGSSDSGSDKLTRPETAGIVVGIFAVVLLVSIAIVRVRARARGADPDYARIS